jgi:pimeloyl-ACP methyl ester carboxylesterase
VVVVGVSGGATIAVEMAIIGSPALVGVIAHEPLVGPLAPELHDVVVRAASRLDATPGPTGATGFVAGLIGDATWERLPETARAFVARHEVAIRQEVPRFADYAPRPSDLAGIDVPLVVSTGAASHARRHAAAAVLEHAAAARAVVVPGAGHLASWEAPDAFASMVSEQIVRWERVT